MYGLLTPIDRILNKYLTDRHARKWLNPAMGEVGLPVTAAPSLGILQHTTDENSSAA